MKKIPLFGVNRRTEQIKADVLKKWQIAVDQTEFTAGRYIKQLETKAADFFDTDYALGTASGTSALLVSLKAAEIGKGDEVITTPLTFCATADVIHHVGATPVFVDVQEDTGNIDPDKIEAAITPKTKAILPVHLYGVPCEMKALMDLAKTHKLILIEDASHAHGSLYRGRPVGSFGQAGCFSLYPSKTIGAFGNAGLIVSNDETFINQARMYANHGIKQGKPKRTHFLHGFNELIDNIQSAAVLSQLKLAQDRIKRRREIAQEYNQIFRQYDHPGMVWPAETKPSLYVYAVQIKQRKEFEKHLEQEQIETGIYYPQPLHLQPSFSDLGYQEGDLPLAESFFAQTISLPIYATLTDDELSRIKSALHGFFKS
jgi:dTDP-4-amino-4,6-dideoxygalactose transaminase